MNKFTFIAIWVVIMIYFPQQSFSVCSLTGCLTCDPYDNSICTQCNGAIGYTLISNQCFPCANQAVRGTACEVCDTNKCLKCLATATFETSSQIKCNLCTETMPNCQRCISPTDCTLCQSGYKLDTSSPPSCVLDCVTLPNCDTCKDQPSGLVCLTCVANYYLNTTTGQCELCTNLPHCTDCLSDGKCTLCENNYWLNFTTGNKTCSSCNLYQCRTCDHGPSCTECQPGYYVHPTLKICYKCQFPCQQCSGTATNCTKCPITQLYYHENFLDPFSCKLCLENLDNCKKCNTAGNECIQCESDLYYVDPMTKKCLGCPTPCKQCVSSTQCTSCLTESETVNPLTKMCEPCSSVIDRCLTCLSSILCLTCDTVGGPYLLTYPPTACVTCQQAHPKCLNCDYVQQYGPACTQCASDHFLSNHQCFQCPLPCPTCDSYNECTSCVDNSYTIFQGMCVECKFLNKNCYLCDSPTNCIKCTNSTIPINGNCSYCSIQQYADEPNQVCLPCVAPCYSCLNQDDCLSCRQFYEYLPAANRCVDLCGDSIVITDACDNSFGVIHDGCTDTCQQEPGYTCVLNPDTVSGQAVKRSVCSYNGKVKIAIKQIVKEPFKNTLTWTYFVMPYLHGLPGTTTRLFTQQELKKVFVLNNVSRNPVSSSSSRQSVKAAVPSLTVEQVSVSPTNSEVSITFSYHHDIRQSDIELLIDFAYLRSLGVPNFATTPDSTQRLNVASYRPDSMIGKFYTQDQYSLAQTLNKVALLIGILSFVAFVVGVFSKELVGLQMAMLCQFSYLSLFYFDGLLELPLFALQSLNFSTGYNLHWADTSYTRLDSTPPQALTLEFDTMTLSNNFNLMALLYILPLVLVVPFIPMKAKCIRKLSMVELGSKWVDLMLGETMLFIVLFNLQYLVFGLVEFYQDGRNIKNYTSQMIIAVGGLFTIASSLGLVFKPAIYGNFRSSFKYNTLLTRDNFDAKKTQISTVRKLSSHFQAKKDQNKLMNFFYGIGIFINDNYFYRNFRKLHSLLTYNHYTLMTVYFVLKILALTLIKSSEIVIIVLTVLVLIELILFRPYGEVSQKIRSVFFFIIYLIFSCVRYFYNDSGNDQQSLFLSQLILGLLIFAVLWTYIVLIKSFGATLYELRQNRSITVEKVFKNPVVDLIDKQDKQAVAEQEEALMRKLMARYQRVELQYNVNNVRNQLIDCEDITGIKSIMQNQQSPLLRKKKSSKQEIISPLQLLKQAQETQYYKDLKVKIEKQKRKSKRQEMKNKVSGQKMLKLLKLDNFKKYQNEFLRQEKNQQPKEQLNKNDLGKQQQKQKQIPQRQYQQNKGSHSEKSIIDELDDYVSVEPQNIQQAQQKFLEQNVLAQENQFLRYERAKKIITRQGLDIDEKLILENYHRI